MSKYTTYKCDECGVLKQETNHWWVVATSPDAHGGLSISPMPPDLPAGEITVCGRACAQKAVERWMAEVTRESAHPERTGPGPLRGSSEFPVQVRPRLRPAPSPVQPLVRAAVHPREERRVS